MTDERVAAYVRRAHEGEVLGEALFAAADLRVHRRFEFIAPASKTYVP